MFDETRKVRKEVSFEESTPLRRGGSEIFSRALEVTPITKVSSRQGLDDLSLFFSGQDVAEQGGRSTNPFLEAKEVVQHKRTYSLSLHFV